MTDHPAAPTTRDTTSDGLLGFWMFLMSDAVLFALLFAIYGTMAPGVADGPERHYEIGAAFAETLILLASSFTFAMASIAMKHGPERGSILRWLAVTLVLGAGFLWLEAHDFATMIASGAGPARNGSLSAFFALVPCHGLHVAAGMIWLIVMMVQVVVIGIDARVVVNLRRLALFWHFLDIIWVAIFSVVYLQGLIR